VGFLVDLYKLEIKKSLDNMNPGSYSESDPKKLKKRNNESLALIKTLGQVISEWKSSDEIEEDNKFIEDYERNLELAKKITPKIIELLKISLKNEIKKIDYHTKKVIMGSTYDEKNKESYLAKRIEIVIQSDNPDKDRWIDQQIYNQVSKLLKDYTPFNPKKYGSPIDILVT
jgi:hypothetical protein